ncbi:MAG TPA: hypothetical protein VI172_17240 [Candidatus Dormibacteraeota bacterium]|jgi:hypothetical protein
MAIDDIGGTSRDLRTLGLPDPAEAHLKPGDTEDDTRTRGRRSLVIGCTLAGTGLIGSLIAAVIGGYSPSISPNVRLFVTLAVIAMSCAGTGFIVDGLTERRDRVARATAREQIRMIADNTARIDVIMGLVGAIPARLDAMEKTLKDVPDYGKGVIDGVQMRAEAAHPYRD